mmetsp:Transcript_20167/g.56794  ORF Transcript_20167/g.56794 Transcript_20167/m.56794 type:complete len:337 (-) Transcript_20167:64-1074(-)
MTGFIRSCMWIIGLAGALAIIIANVLLVKKGFLWDRRDCSLPDLQQKQLDPDLGATVSIDADAEYLILAKTTTAPSFYISMHREKDDTPRAPILYTGQYYEKRKTADMKVLALMQSPGMQGLFVDVGANIGWFSLYMAALGRQVVSFEPNPANLKKLQQSVAVNRFSHRIHLVPYGAGPAASLLHFRNVRSNMGMGHLITDKKSKVAGDVMEVHVKRVDDVLKDVPEPWRRRVCIVKIDVEGFEAGALQGILGTLRRHKPVVWVELTQGKHEEHLANGYYNTLWEFVSLGYWSSAGVPTESIDAMAKWFQAVVAPSKNPSDLLFWPDRFNSSTVPF